jgi:hydroxyethylthiazole kinase-like uncharacterized protein yjeF
MNVAVGVDVTAIDRIAALLQRRPRFATKIFTDAERRRIGTKVERYATRWAAKEAVKKLYGSRGLAIPTYHSIEVVNRRGGAPLVRVHGADTDIAISLTHDAGLAIAVATAPDSGLGAPPALMPPQGLHLPERPPAAHKGTFGTVVVIAGARGTAGAAVLSSTGAARGGAGLIRVCVPEPVYAVVAAQCLEVMAHALPASGAGIGPDSVAELREHHLGIADAVVIGPGLGRAAETETALLQLLTEVRSPMVVDADGLNIAAANDFDWRLCQGPVVLTPHPAEMARLAGSDVRTVQADREETARGYATAHGVVVVLKGAETVIAAPDGRIHRDRHQTVALATGGTGDVLAGVCGAMLAAGLGAFDAAVAAVTIHAEAGCIVEAERGRAGGLARDLLEALPMAQERLRRMQERIAEYQRMRR